MSHRITLRESPRRHMLATRPDFDVLLNGVKVERAYFNMRGYRVGLPLPGGGMLDPGEISLSRLNAEIRRINREARS
jgi:hypothetical protein